VTKVGRFRCDSATTVVPQRIVADDRAVSIQMTVALSLVGLGAVAAGALGLRLPAGDRLAAGLALVVGAGVGLVAIAVGSQLVEDGAEAEAYETVFLVASALGFLATVSSLGLLWRSGETARLRAAGR
jgi:hypothetical protein